jgi:hypothetical protein
VASEPHSDELGEGQRGPLSTAASSQLQHWRISIGVAPVELVGTATMALMAAPCGSGHFACMSDAGQPHHRRWLPAARWSLLAS